MRSPDAFLPRDRHEITRRASHGRRQDIDDAYQKYQLSMKTVRPLPP